MPNRPFDTPLEMSGPFRMPRQMLADQEYGGHLSIHDDETAEKLGFSGAPIEGPTHFSQFVPLLVELWGEKWIESGRLSSHYQNMVVEGEEVKAFVEIPRDGATQVRVRAEKKDGTPVLTGTASISADDESELDSRMARLRTSDQLIILRDMNVGDKGVDDEIVSMDFDQHLGKSYPFTLNDKLEAITENTSWHTATGDDNPWGRPIIPLEMVCVLCQFSSRKKGWNVREPNIGLFANLEIGMVKGPLFVGDQFRLEREVIAIGETRRTEGYWTRTLIRDAKTDDVLAYSLLQQAIMKDSFPTYAEEAEALQKAKRS